ncbi:MAG: kynureninase [Chitinophagales bacterium]|nr:kynureninase [Chitinophagales bacterium]
MSLDEVRAMDATDPMASFRSHYHIPQHDGKDAVYLCGNSLGLQPKKTRQYIEEELKDWETLGVEGHMHGRHPWFYYHHFLEESVARLAGASPLEVVIMNTLTVNLNLLMVSFYRPTKSRYKILMEYMAFPSDQYAMEMQVRYHGFDTADAIVEVKPREGEHALRTEDILQLIDEHRNELALVMMGGVNYYTGQLYDMATITKAAHDAGALAGFDLAHAAGNVPLHLHDWGVDFACWCTYKYLNSGPGGASGVFIHERHAHDATLPRFAGWWGNAEDTRFQMKKGFHPQPGAAGWQQSNAQILPMAAHRAAMELFDQAGMDALRTKSLALTGLLEELLQIQPGKFHIITPADPAQRGCQLSILTGAGGRQLFDRLTASGVIADWREPNVIRVAPVPMYNSFEDVYRFAELMYQD